MFERFIIFIRNLSLKQKVGGFILVLTVMLSIILLAYYYNQDVSSDVGSKWVQNTQKEPDDYYDKDKWKSFGKLTEITKISKEDTSRISWLDKNVSQDSFYLFNTWAEMQEIEAKISNLESQIKTVKDKKILQSLNGEMVALEKQKARMFKMYWIRDKYINTLKSTSWSTFKMRDVLFVQNNFLRRDLLESNMIQVDLKKATEIIKKFESKDYVKLNMELEWGAIISSDILYVVVGGAYYDENTYFYLQKSIKNGYSNFIFYQNPSNSFKESIFEFVTGYDPKRGYFETLTLRILKSNYSILNELITGNESKDLWQNQILKSFVSVLKWEITPKFINVYQFQDLLGQCL